MISTWWVLREKNDTLYLEIQLIAGSAIGIRLYNQLIFKIELELELEVLSFLKQV
jgi:hypothetical protein